MADLEDFFAKRDKKKKMKGQKFETTGLDDVAKILDAKVKERKKQETNKSTYQVPISDTTTDQQGTDYRANEDDEWKEVVEEKPDYTGLKIQELILEDEDEIGGKDGTGQEDGDKPTEGAWIKKRTPQPEPTSTPLPTPVEEEKIPPSESPVPSTDDKPEVKTPEEIPIATPTEPEAPPKNVYVPVGLRKAREEAAAREAALATSIAAATSTIPRPVSASSSATPAATTTEAKPGGAYVPPSRRGLTPGSSSSSGPTKPKKHVAAPNINDEQYFPSLGGDGPVKHS